MLRHGDEETVTPARLLLACLSGPLLLSGCKACIQIDLPDPPNDDPDPLDTSTHDSGDTAEHDSGPPPACDQPEVEPNNSVGTANEISMESWSCGAITTSGDLDHFHFDVPEAGWLKVWVRGADFGSSSDLSLILQADEGEVSAQQSYQLGTTDPMLVVPIDAPGGWTAQVSDQYGGYGEDFEWKMLATVAKAPVEWTVEEEEPFNSFDAAQAILAGDRVYGVVSSGTDRDWFKVTLPEGKSTISIDFDAWGYGSPLDAWVYLYDAEQTKKTSSDHGNSAQDMDPILEFTTSTAGDWYILVKPDDGAAAGDLYWYVFQVDVETTATE